MKEALWGYWLVILGIFIIVVLLLVQSFTTTNTQDYYLVKTITEAAMEDSIDWSYYRLYGEIKINKEKFYESFLRRFAEEASLATTYTIEFTEVYEAPPKVGVKVSSKSSTFNVAGDSTTFDIVNKIDAILESHEVDAESTASNPPLASDDADTPEPGNTTNTTPGNTTPTPEQTGNTTTGGNESNPPETNTTTPSETPEELTTVCTDDYKVVDATGVKGYGMVDLNVRDNNGTKVGDLAAGDEFKIIGESKKDSSRFLIEYGLQKCGYVYKSYVAVNLQEYFPNVGVNNFRINITNKTGTLYAIDDKTPRTPIVSSDGTVLTGKALYSGAHKPIATYSFAQKLAKALRSTSRTIVIYDTYRPYAVSDYVSKVYQSYLDSYVNAYGSTYEKQVASSVRNYGLCWFLACNLSTHNTACAADVSFEGASMPTEMHVLTPEAAKSNTDSKELKKIMADNGGLSTLKSEWWHFQDNTCYNTIKNEFNRTGKYASFWSAV